MALYKMRSGDKTMEPIGPTTLSASGIRERQDLQAALRDNPGVISPDLFVVAEEFSNWEDSASRIDLLCIDRDAKLVVIELKRDDSRSMDVQAIRYAAMISAMSFEDVVSAHAAYLKKRGRSNEDSYSLIREFLDIPSNKDIVVSTAPRIILLASSFSREVTTTVLWLNERGLDITCMQSRIYEIAGEIYLDIEQVIPLPSASDYQVRLRDKAIKAEREETIFRRGRRTVSRLVEAGILTPGTRLRLIKDFKGLDIPDARARFITFTGKDGRESFRWNYNGEEYATLSAVCTAIFDEWGGRPESEFNSTSYWGIDKQLSAGDKPEPLYVLAQRVTNGEVSTAEDI